MAGSPPCMGHLPIWVTLSGSHCMGHNVWVIMCGSQCVCHIFEKYDNCAQLPGHLRLVNCDKYCMAHGCATRKNSQILNIGNGLITLPGEGRVEQSLGPEIKFVSYLICVKSSFK